MYTLSPVNPPVDSVDPTSLHVAPHLRTSDSSSTPRCIGSVTGTRRKVTPESLVPLDAPTRPRKYITPSATSRKEIPALFAKKRSRSEAFEDEQDELVEEPLPSNATDKEQIEWKRRQNTLAARRSRKRKLMHQQVLEDTVEQLTKEKDVWKTRTFSLQQILRSHGICCPDFVD